MQTAGRFISTLAILAYLTATFLPCASESWASSARASTQRTTVSTSSHHSVNPDPEGSPAREAHAHSHAGSHPASASKPVEKVPATQIGVFAELKSICLCGCSDTRSTIGGGAARLGRLIPGTVLFRLFELEIEAPPIRPLAHFDEVTFEIDPIPV